MSLRAYYSDRGEVLTVSATPMIGPRIYPLDLDPDTDILPGDRVDLGTLVVTRSGTPEERLARAKALRCAEVNELRQRKIGAGIVALGHTWDADELSLSKLNQTLTVLSRGLTLPPGFVWRTKDNIDIPVTAQDLDTLAFTIFNYGAQVHMASFRKKNEINALASVYEVMNYDINAGWE